MDYRLLSAGDNAPDEINAIVEIPRGEGRIKYEFRANGAMIVDRLRSADLPLYPTHYCGVPGTLGPDGDPLDLLILGTDEFKTGDVVAVRPIAVMWMTDEKGSDPKIIAVPADSLTDEYLGIRSLADVSMEQRQQIEKFFREYKKNDHAGKWSRTDGWEDVAAAHKLINEGIALCKKSAAKPAAAPKPPKP